MVCKKVKADSPFDLLEALMELIDSLKNDSAILEFIERHRNDDDGLECQY